MSLMRRAVSRQKGLRLGVVVLLLCALMVTALGGPSVSAAEPEFEVGQWLVVNTDTVTLRNGAGTRNGSIATLTSGEWVMIKNGPLSSEGYTWYQVLYGDKVGWVAGEYLGTSVTWTSDAEASTPTSGSTTTTTTQTWSYGQWLRVDTDWVTLRSAAGTSASAITKLVTGEWVMVKDGPTTANGISWYKVYSDYGDGWVAGQYLNTTVAYTGTPGTSSGSIAPTASSFTYGQWLRVNTDWVTLRSAAGTSAGAITQLTTGEWVMIEEGPTTSGGYEWYKVYTDSGRGWVAGEFLAKTVTYTGAAGATSGGATTGATWAVGKWLRVDTDTVTLRSGAGTTYAALKTLGTGEWVMVKEGPIAAGGYQWYKVYTDYGDGWVAGQFLNTSVTYTGTAGTSSSSATSSTATWGYGQWLRVDTDWVTLRSSASASSSAIETLATGEWVMVKEGPTVAGGYEWYKVYTDYGDGWIAGEFLNTSVTYSGGTAVMATTYDYGQWLVVDDVNVKLRSGAGTGYTTLGTFSSGDWVMIQDGPVSADGYVWYQVWSDYGIGWVAAEFIARP